MTHIETVTNQQQIEQTVTLAKSIWRQHYLSIIGPDQIEYMLNKYQSPAAIQQQITDGYLYYLAHYNNEFVGYLALVPDNKQSRLMISKIYVNSLLRGTGVGYALLTHTKNKARALKLQTIWLTVNVHNANSIDWYLKQGFVKVDKVKADIGNGYFMDDYILELKC